MVNMKAAIWLVHYNVICNTGLNSQLKWRWYRFRILSSSHPPQHNFTPSYSLAPSFYLSLSHKSSDPLPPSNPICPLPARHTLSYGALFAITSCQKCDPHHVWHDTRGKCSHVRVEHCNYPSRLGNTLLHGPHRSLDQSRWRGKSSSIFHHFVVFQSYISISVYHVVW